MSRVDAANETLARSLDRAAALIFGTPLYILVAIVLAHGLLQNGMWDYVMNGELMEVSQNLGERVELDTARNEWVMYSVLGPMLANALGMNRSGMAFMFVHLVVFLLVFCLGLFFINRQVGGTRARVILGAIFLTPMLQVMFTWLGTPDPFTLAFALVLVLLWRSPWWIAPAALLMSLNHAEQGLVLIAVASLFLFFAYPKHRVRIVVFFLVGAACLAVGRAAHEAYYAARDATPALDRSKLLLSSGILDYGRAAISNPWTLIWSWHGAFWPALILLLVTARGTNLLRAFFLSSALALFSSVAFSLDNSRVLMLLGLVPLLLLLVSDELDSTGVFDHPVFRRVFAAGCVAGLIIPRVVVWDGKIHSSAAFFTVYRFWKVVFLKEPVHIDPFHSLF